MPANSDGQTSRSLATQAELMLSAETLIAEKGVHQISIREIVKAAGQKNESALQYHFKNLQGLLDAIKQKRAQEIRDKRTELLSTLLASNQTPELRDLVRLMVMPVFLLAKSDNTFRRYLSAFAYELALTEDSVVIRASQSGAGGESGEQLAALLRANRSHLKEADYRQRMEMAVRLCSITMGNLARKKLSFRSEQADLHLSHLLDGVEGLLKAEVSKETRSLT